MGQTMTETALEDVGINATLGDGQEPGTDVPAEAPEQAQEESATSEEESPKRNRLQERFSELTAQREHWRKKAQDEERQRLEAESRLQQDPTEFQMVQQLNHVVGQKPEVSDFPDEQKWAQSYEQWTQAVQQLQLGLYGYQQRREAQRKRDMETQTAKRALEEERHQHLQEKTGKAIASREDWYEVVTNPAVPSLPQASPAAWEAVMDSDQFADLTYYLGKHPDEVRQLSTMTPVGAIRHIAKLEAALSQQPAAPPPGKPPPSDLPGRGGSSDPEKMDIDSWMAWRNSNLRE